MPTTAERIIEKLTREKNEDQFQLFADRFAEVYKPEVFENINYFSGMNARHHSTKGHPDAWKRYKGGIACLEATTINDAGLKSKVKDDVKNLAEELKTANLHATFALFILTAHCDRLPSDSSQLEKDLREFTAQALNLKEDEIDIVLGYQLVSILEKPQYAPLLIRHFGIQCSYSPLHSVTEDIRFKHPSYQFPDVSAFEKNQVYVSSILADNCVRILDEHLRILVKGLSGSGKTVLAFILAFYYRARNYESLYIDMRERNDFPLKELISFSQQNAHKRMLIIIDNVQYCPSLVQDYHELRIAQEANGFKTLFITPTFPKNSDSTAEPNFEDIFIKDGGKPVILSPSPESIKSLFKCFELSTIQTVWKDSDLWDIFQRFGQDLYLLAFALKSFGSQRIFEGKLSIESPDFGNAVMKRFIAPSISAAKGVENLATLACFSTLDLLAPRSVFFTENNFIPVFKTEMKLGYVRKTSTGSFIFSHAAIGFAVISEYCRHENKVLLNVLQENLTRAPELIKDIADTVFEQERIPKNALAKSLFTNNDFLCKAFAVGAILTTRQIPFIQKCCPGFSKEYNRIIRTDTKAFAKALASSDLISLINFLFSSFKENANEFSALIPELICNVDAILKQAGKTAPHTIKDVLHKLERIASNKTLEPSCVESLKKLRSLILNEISKTEAHSRFFALCTRSRFSLEYLRSVLEYLTPEKPNFQHAVLQTILSDDNLVKLVDRGLGAPLEHFINFLQYAIEKNNFEPDKLIPELQKEYRLLTISDKFYGSPFDLTFPYLFFWLTKDSNGAKEYGNKLVEIIFNSANKHMLLDKLRRCSLPHVCNFFSAIREIKFKEALVLEELTEDDSITAIFNSSNKIPVPQFIAFAEKLKTHGAVAEAIANKLLIRNQGYGKSQTRQIDYRSVGEIASHLDRLRQSDKGGQIAFRQAFQQLKCKGVFGRSISYMLERASQRPYATSHRIGHCNLRHIWKVLCIVKDTDEELMNKLLELVNLNIDSFISEPIDHVNDFLQNLDISENPMMISSGVQIRSCLVSEKYIDKFVSHCLSSGVSYMANFFRQNFKEHREFVLAIVHQIENKNYKELLICCARTRPSELVAFLKFIDLRRKNEIWLSGGIILAELFGTYITTFSASIKNAKPEQNAGLRKYLEDRYPRFLPDFSSNCAE
jgi:hypothetical protein